MDSVQKTFLKIFLLWFFLLGIHFYFIPIEKIEKIESGVVAAVYLIVYLKYGLLFLSMWTVAYFEENFLNFKIFKSC